jgi:demethylmenaquinone methyltransferase/2-methoxy-6-polyprenyl-1,4-benzoquinol methylase
MDQKTLDLSEKSQQIQTMFNKISPKYDFLNSLLSFGQDTRWRNALLKQLPCIPTKDGILIDVACGTGDVVLAVLKKRKDFVKLYGFDISQGMLDRAYARTPYQGVSYSLASAEKLPSKDNTADVVTIAFGLRNVDDRVKALEEFHRILKPTGTLFVLEFFPAKNSLFRSLFQFYFKKILPMVGGLFSDKDAYAYLPQSVKTMPSAIEFEEQLKLQGFDKITKTSWLAGSTVLFRCVKS